MKRILFLILTTIIIVPVKAIISASITDVQAQETYLPLPAESYSLPSGFQAYRPYYIKGRCDLYLRLLDGRFKQIEVNRPLGRQIQIQKFIRQRHIFDITTYSGATPEDEPDFFASLSFAGLSGGNGGDSDSSGMPCCCLRYHPRKVALLPYENFSQAYDRCGVCGVLTQSLCWIPAVLCCPPLFAAKLCCGDCCVSDQVFTN